MTRRTAAALLALGLLAACGDDPDPVEGTGTTLGDGDGELDGDGGGAGGMQEAATELALPDVAAFPEGIALDPDSGDLLVGSTEDGAVYRRPGGADAFEVFLEGGTDLRPSVVGLAVGGDRLVAAGGRSGAVYVHDLADGALVSTLQAPPAEATFLNDVAIAGDAAYVTDSMRPVLFRAPLDADGDGVLEAWLDLDGTPLDYEDGFNLNGIAATGDGSVLLAVQSNTGALWRIDVATREVEEVDLGGEALTGGDGLELDGATALVVRNSSGLVARLELSDDLRSGELVEEISDPAFAFPTTAVVADGRLYVVNGQLDRSLEEATRPFTVSSLPYEG